LIFNSYTFVVFFLIVVGLYHLPVSWKIKKTHLLISSYLFYAAWNPPFVLLLWLSTMVDWHVVRRMSLTDDPGKRKFFLAISMAVNLGLLGFFKYANFVSEIFSDLIFVAGLWYSPPGMDIILPVGISFYTFQTMSYSLDVYRKDMRPWPSFLDFALFVTFFPQLVAGPIVRARDFLPQCLKPIKVTGAQMGWGLSLVTLGLFEKVILADTFMAPIVNDVYQIPYSAGFIDAWLGTIAFGWQIFFDFSGYSNCAIGAALCLGFALPDNFRFPYTAVGFSDFWRRWHISLSTWLRDYLYISLGGNRDGERKTYRNLFLTMLLGGLWHGSSWNFIVWGGMHGLYLSIERWIKSIRGPSKKQGELASFGLAILTFLLVTLTWVFFRADNSYDAYFLLMRMLWNGAGAELLNIINVSDAWYLFLFTCVLLIGQWKVRDLSLEELWQNIPTFIKPALLALAILAIFFIPTQGENSAFIYFQF